MPYRDPEARREYMRAYYAAHREELIAKALAWKAAHPEQARENGRRWERGETGRAYRDAHRREANAATRKWRSANPDKVAAKNRTTLLRGYGLTHEAYESMLAAQGGVCAICRQPERHRSRSGSVSRMAIDHDHVTGLIRALLCHSCNTGIGSFFDDPALLRAAADYIEGARR